MTFGQKLKKLRTEANITQKGLADELHVTFQTISKWESDINEPDFSTLKAIAKVFQRPIEYFFNEEEQPAEVNKEVRGEPEVVVVVPAKAKTGTCRDCGVELFENDMTHTIERISSSGVKEMVTICDNCFNKHEEEIDRRVKEVNESMKPVTRTRKVGTGPFRKIVDRNDSKPLIWSIAIGIAVLVITLIICIVNYSSVGIGWTIGAPLLAGYGVMATIYCIFTVSFVSDVFMGVAGWSIKFPGLIFTFDLDGIMWLIGMKILFGILGIILGIGVFLLALGLSMFLSVFSFIPLLIYNKTHY
jgi:DNA-binding XRE family transcriptional regulator